jgi:hypothetical protein
LENATKKRNIRIDAKTTNWPLWDIAKLGEGCLVLEMLQNKIQILLCGILLIICNPGLAALTTLDRSGNAKSSFLVGEEIRIAVIFSDPYSLPSNLTTSFQWGIPTGSFSESDYGSSFEIVNWIGGAFGGYGGTPSTSTAFDFPGTFRILFNSQGSGYDYSTGYFRDYAFGGQKDIQVIIPEPSALSLIAVGLGGLVAALRRRR